MSLYELKDTGLYHIECDYRQPKKEQSVGEKILKKRTVIKGNKHEETNMCDTTHYVPSISLKLQTNITYYY